MLGVCLLLRMARGECLVGSAYPAVQVVLFSFLQEHFLGGTRNTHFPHDITQQLPSLFCLGVSANVDSDSVVPNRCANT